MGAAEGQLAETIQLKMEASPEVTKASVLLGLLGMKIIWAQIAGLHPRWQDSVGQS